MGRWLGGYGVGSCPQGSGLSSDEVPAHRFLPQTSSLTHLPPKKFSRGCLRNGSPREYAQMTKPYPQQLFPEEGLSWRVQRDSG